LLALPLCHPILPVVTVPLLPTQSVRIQNIFGNCKTIVHRENAALRSQEVASRAFSCDAT
jgi:hypothetical protein